MKHIKIYWLFVFLLGALLFLPGLSGDFLFDDASNILANKVLKIPILNQYYLREAAFSYGDDGTGRPLAMVTLAITHFLFGGNPLVYKLFNMFIHVVNSLLIFYFLLEIRNRIVSGDKAGARESHLIYFPYVVSLLWFISPINLSPVLYVVQRMTSMEALFAISSFIAYFRFRHAINLQKWNKALFWCALVPLFAFLALLCKETAILIPLLICLIEFFLFSSLENKTRVEKFLRRFALCAAFIPAILILIKFYLSPGWIVESYSSRDFTIVERILMGGKILWFYAYQTIIPNNFVLGLYHDDWLVLHRPTNGLIETLYWLVWFAIIAIAIVKRKKFPLLSFGVSFFFAAHLLESTFLGLELVHEHRNYLPSIGLLVFFYALSVKIISVLNRPKFTLCVLVAYILLLSLTLGHRVRVWGDLVEHAKHEFVSHPLSLRASYQYGRVLLMTGIKTGEKRFVVEAADQFYKCLDMDKSDLLGLSGLIFIENTHKDLNLNKQELLDEFIWRVTNGKLHIAAISAYKAVFDSLPEDEADNFTVLVFERVFENKLISNAGKSEWKKWEANFRISRGEYEKAEQSFVAAIDYSGGSKRIKLDFATFLVSIGEYGRANKLLKSIDGWLFSFKNPSYNYFLEVSSVGANDGE